MKPQPTQADPWYARFMQEKSGTVLAVAAWDKD